LLLFAAGLPAGSFGEVSAAYVERGAASWIFAGMNFWPQNHPGFVLLFRGDEFLAAESSWICAFVL